MEEMTELAPLIWAICCAPGAPCQVRDAMRCETGKGAMEVGLKRESSPSRSRTPVAITEKLVFYREPMPFSHLHRAEVLIKYMRI